MVRFSVVMMCIGLTSLLAGCSTGSMGGNVKFIENKTSVDVRIGETTVATYRFGPELVKPVLYPVRTLSGVQVTRAYPFEEIEGESHDHPHHTGFFFTYDDVNGNRFWAATTPPPQIRHVGITRMKESLRRGTLSTLADWVDTDGKVLLRENRTMDFRLGANEYAIDFTITLTAEDTTVVFGPTKEGMFAIRVAPWLRENGGAGAYLSSRSGTNANEIWGKRAEWVLLEGTKDGNKYGIAIMNHPSSVNYPTFWHARDYGLFSANPLGESFFRKSLGEDNPGKYELILKKGESALFRFRMIIYEGSRNKLEMDYKFNDYSRM